MSDNEEEQTSTSEPKDIHHLLMREAWESFLIANKKRGLMHRSTYFEDDVYTTDLLTAFEMGEKAFIAKHTCSYRYEDGVLSWLDYEYRTPEGSTLAVVKENKVHAEIAGARKVFDLPDRGLVGYLYHAILASMNLEEGSRFEYVELSDSDPTQTAQCRYKCIGTEEIMVGRQKTPIWIFGKKTGRKPGNIVWLDCEHNIVKSDWSGANSVLVSGVESAFDGLNPNFIGAIEKFLEA